MDKEHQISFHIMLLAVFTVLSLLLDIIILISGWENAAVVPITAAVIVCWGVHFIKIGSDEQRLYLYVIMILLVLGYYAFQGSTITDVPIILCLLLTMLSKKNDTRLIYMVTGSYIIYLLGNLVFTDYLGVHTEQIVFSRIVLGIVCLISTCLISIYFIRQYETVAKKLNDTREKLLVSQKENELFLANMSHELRTPINAVNGVSEMLQNSNLPEKEKRGIGVIQSAGRRLNQQVSDVLDYSEIETGHFSLTYDEYEPVSVIHDVINMVCDGEKRTLSNFSGRKNADIDLAVDVDPSLPKLLYGDAERMKKLLGALLDNALKFTEAGGVYLYIQGRKEKYGINLNIDLWDTGCGISEEKRKQLFYGSYLGDNSAERKKRGLGLGLAIAHGIVSAMQGFLTIESVPEEGTHVHVSIPQEVRSEEPSMTLEQPEKYRPICYLNREKYARPEIAAFFYRMIEHVRTGFGLDIMLASSLQEVKEACESGMITHLYVASWEYGMEPEFYDRMAEKFTVCVLAEQEFRPTKGSQIDILYKPIFMLAVVNHLRDTLPGAPREKKDSEKISARQGEKKIFKALVVDDEEMNLVVAKGILEGMGLNTEVCGSGMLAVEKCNIADYDIIFMDYMMPQMNGVKAMQKIREIRNGYYKEKPIVVFTANAVSGAKESFMKEGFDDFIAKPLEMKYMKRILSKYLEL